MVFFDRTRREIVSNSLDRLSETTNISQLAPGSKARFVLDTIGQEQENQHRIFDTNLMQAFIKYADGKFLDFFGDMMNNPRNPATFAESDNQNFMFYVSTGTFGDINSGANFTIPAGTTVQTVPYEGSVITPGIESQPVISYRTTENVICISSQSFVYVPVRATIEGRNSDVPRSVLNQHDFTQYINSTNQTLKCTNQYAISNGEDRESNDSYRFRLASVFEARSLAVFAAIRLAALSMPGVSDIKEVMCEQGPGTYSIYVKGFTPTTSPKLLREVGAACELVTSFGVRPFILAPPPLGTEFVAAVSWNPRATQAQIAEGYRDMRNALERYMNTTDIGQSIVVSDLIDVLLQSTPYALSIGANNANEFEEIYIYRSDPVRDGTVRNIFTGSTIEPLYNERAILETSGRHRGIQFITRSNT
jgi:uncharacterized phage protein gp47/JayE